MWVEKEHSRLEHERAFVSQGWNGRKNDSIHEYIQMEIRKQQENGYYSSLTTDPIMVAISLPSNWREMQSNASTVRHSSTTVRIEYFFCGCVRRSRNGNLS
jgi:hypothetical protein